jgi:peptidoglycan/LPS O-acetylase OafA/YrhL
MPCAFVPRRELGCSFGGEMKKRNHTIDYLRGVAAVMVCFCHFRHALPEFFSRIAKHGDLGVQIFFVISGYIIPYSLEKGGYRIADFGRFWAKRLLRLQPAFIVALLVTFAMSSAAALLKGDPPAISPLNLAKGFFYLWIPSENPVIWTLIVEIKYYLFISLFFPFLFSRSDFIRRGSYIICLLVSVGLIGYVESLRYLPFFLVGFAACYLSTRRSAAIEALLLGLLALGAAGAGSSMIQISVGGLTALAILFLPSMDFKIGLFLGSISYSLYLLHFPVGVKILNFALPHVSRAWQPLLIPIDILVCVAVAYGLFLLVEKPSSNWSQRIPISADKKPSAHS